MSTAHRPTWHNAIGVGLEERGSTVSVSSKDLPSHTELKRRAPFSLTLSESAHPRKLSETKKLLRERLEETETAHKTKNLIEDQVGVTKNFLSLEDATKLLNCEVNAFPEDEDDFVEVDEETVDDEEAALLRELEKIKKEKEEIKEREREEQLKSEENREKLLSRNPLMNPSKQARRWDEDVVFKNPQSQSKQPTKYVFLNSRKSPFLGSSYPFYI
ncbi:uncharacterized protein TA18560 [Theileria annulata]|uniref:Cwf15/Cwc15 cell cycle control protein n=1 Tax=Theileria annulata TaxID=5874 RepID=Q4UBH6_THEAN|nr:uncharacterized protein TA18560 [Theileria annulata]CAI75825.1 hypothetical protein, conserved [Theileria annulata]|eukprot:XP_955301.1 hypothetical protein, conserved [Theileria annulata]